MTKAKNSKPKRTSVEEVGKIHLIESLLSKIQGGVPENTRFGGSDDSLWLNSHKLLLEGLDFDLVFTPLKHLGYKAIASVLGPLYAQNHVPESISVNLGLSQKFCVEDIEELWMGMLAAFEEYKVSSVNLDLLPSLTGLTISLSSLGKQKKETFVQTPKPAKGDLICISGSLGAAYMGLQLLEREKRLFSANPTVQPKLDGYKFILKSFLNPELNTSVIELLNKSAIIPSDGSFITNGLGDSVKKICRKNNLGAKIFLDKIPIASQTFAMAEELNMDAITAAINGGDDYQFIYIIPLSKYEAVKKELPQLDIIGHLCSPDLGAKLITPDGAELELKAQGWSE